MMRRFIFQSFIQLGLPYLIVYGPFQIGESQGTRLIMLLFLLGHLGLFFLTHQVGTIKKIVVKKDSFEHFLGKTFVLILTISFYCAGYYHSMYIADNSTFSGVVSHGFFFDFIQFYLLSSAITLLSDFSPINPVSLYAQGLMYLHSLIVFMAVVLIIANYREAATISFIKGPDDEERTKP